MADRYWVGGSGTWNTSSTTNWSSTSGGAAGAAVPTAADNVFFDQAGTYTVTMTGALACLDITVSAGTATFATGTSPTLAISGSMSLIAATIWNSTAAITFTSTTPGRTISANNVIINASVTLNGVGGAWTLGSNFSLGSTNTLTFTNGTFNASTYNVTVGLFSSNNSNVRTLSLGSGLWTLSGTGTVWDFGASTTTNFTFNANTANITLSATSATARTFNGGSQIFNKLTIGGATGSSTTTIAGSNFFTELASTKTVEHTVTLQAGSTQSILNWTITGTVGNVVTLNATSTSYIVTPNRPSTLNYINATNIWAYQAPFYLGTGSTVTTCTNVFASAYVAPFTHYWVGGAGNWLQTARWSNASGGTGGFSVPYGDEDVIFDSNSSASSYTFDTLTGGAMYCKNLTLNPPASGTLSYVSGGGSTSQMNVFGSFTVANTGISSLSGGSGSWHAFTYRSIEKGNTINLGCMTGFPAAGFEIGGHSFVGFNGEWTLQSSIEDYTQVSHTAGTLDTNNFNIQTLAVGSITTPFSSTGNIIRTLKLGSSIINCSSWFAGGIFSLSGTNLTFDRGTSTVAGRVISNGSYKLYTIANPPGATLSSYSNGSFDYLAGWCPGTISVSSNLSVLGISTIGNTNATNRVLFATDVVSLSRVITVTQTQTQTIQDADFRDIVISGAGAPISGTRIGDLRGCSGITFSTPKTVYWNLAGAQNWSANGWSDTPTGTPNFNFFPLAQDTATFTNSGSVTGTITMNSAIPYTGTVDMSGRTNAMTLSVGAFTIYGDWKNGSGTTLSGSGTLTFSGRNTQTITSAGKTFSGGIAVDSYGGTVNLGDALNVGTFNNVTITNGTFSTNNYNVTVGSFSSTNSNIRVINLGSSTVTAATDINFATSTNLTFNAGTSSIVCSGLNPNFSGGGLSFASVSFTNTGNITLTGTNTFTNLTIAAPSATGYRGIGFATNQTITGTLTVAGASPVLRIFVRSDTLGTTRTLTVGTLSATDCDFRDITIAGTAAGSSPTRAGDCGGNSGITFPAPKTVYWNLAGAQNWSATGWAPTSGGTPNINNFPLPQDTAVFDNTGSAGTVTFDVGWFVGTVDASARTTAMTLSTSTLIPFVYGDWKFGTGVTSSSTTGALTFAKRGTQTITSNGVTFGCPVTINPGVTTGTVQLADALTIEAAKTLTLTTGTFDAATFNATVGLFSAATGSTLKMGTGTWTLSGTGTVWSGGMTNLYVGTANIVLSDTSTTARTFAGGGFSYNKLTIGGTTGTSTTTITANNQFTELASTKTVAHTIALGTTTQTFGKWTITGTVGNVVTLTGTGTSHVLSGACTDSIDYLAMGSIGFAATSPGEFYAGANSTATSAVAPVYLTAKPADSTRYWVGGTGNWSDTARWSTSSGGASGASVPRSHDDVVFDSASNAIAYTATVDAVTGGIRMKALTIAGPASGNVTLAGSTAINGIHNNVTLPATGLTLTYTGAITLSGSTTGRTLTTNGVALASAVTVNGVNCEWTLGSALNMGSSTLTVTNGIFKASTYNITAAAIVSNNANIRTVDFGSSTLTLSGTAPINFGTTEANRANLTVTAGTAQINCSSNTPTFTGNNQTVYNVAFTSTSAGTVTLNGVNTFNNLSFTGITAAGLKIITLSANQTINGTFSCVAGPDARARIWFYSSVLGTTRTLTCAAVSLIDADFSDIQIAGAAAPASGTRLGDAQGNSGITFTSKTVYWNLPAGGNWKTSIPWALTSGGSPDVNNFPLAQDTAIIEATGLNSGATITMSNTPAGSDTTLYPSIDLSARTTNTVTLSWPANTFVMFGNITLASGVTWSASSGGIYFYKRNGNQELTSAGNAIAMQAITIANINGTLLLKDAANFGASLSFGFTHSSGTINLDGYTFTISGLNGAVFSGQGINFGTNGQFIATSSFSSFNLAFGTQTFSGSGTISMTPALAKTLSGGGNNFNNVAINQGGAGTLTITGNNTFGNITNTYKSTGATTIAMGTTTQRVSQWTAAGESGRLLTIQGTSASSPCTLVHTGTGTAANVDYLNIVGVRAY